MNGLIKKFIFESKDLGILSDSELVNQLLLNSKCLFSGYINNTYMYTVTIKPEFINISSLYTIFSKRNEGSIPYLVTALSKDLINNSVSREVIDQETEKEIFDIADDIVKVDFDSIPIMIIEDSCGENYIIIEGNKRTVGMHIAQNNQSLPVIRAYVGKTNLCWSDMLALHEMNSNA